MNDLFVFNNFLKQIYMDILANSKIQSLRKQINLLSLQIKIFRVQVQMSQGKQKLQAMRRLLKKKVVNHSPVKTNNGQEQQNDQKDRQSKIQEIELQQKIAKDPIIEKTNNQTNPMPIINIQSNLKQKQELNEGKEKQQLTSQKNQANKAIMEEGEIDEDQEENKVGENSLQEKENVIEQIKHDGSHSQKKPIITLLENIQQSTSSIEPQNTALVKSQPIHSMEIEENQPSQQNQALSHIKQANEIQPKATEKNTNKLPQTLNTQHSTNFHANKQEKENLPQNSLNLINHNHQIITQNEQVHNQTGNITHVQTQQVNKLPELEKIKENKNNPNEIKNTKNKPIQTEASTFNYNERTDPNSTEKVHNNLEKTSHHTLKPIQSESSHPHKDLSLHNFHGQNNSSHMENKRKTSHGTRPAIKVILKQLQMIKASIHNLSVTYRGVEYLREEIRKDSILKRKIKDRLEDLHGDDEFDILRKLVKKIQSQEANVSAATVRQSRATNLSMDAVSNQHNEIVQRSNQQHEVPVSRESIEQ